MTIASCKISKIIKTLSIVYHVRVKNTYLKCKQVGEESKWVGLKAKVSAFGGLEREVILCTSIVIGVRTIKGGGRALKLINITKSVKTPQLASML